MLKTLTPDTIEDDSARETAEDMAAPDLKTQIRQSPIHYRARVDTDRDEVAQPAARVSRCARACGWSPTIKIGRRSILDYVLNPITRVLDESLHEP